MASDLLETKLRAPVPRAGYLPRARLVERLATATDARVVLVSAPPGFGKSTLVAAWLDGLGGDVARAWLSLDAADDDPIRCWRYVVAALHAADAALGADAAAILTSSDPAVERASTSLLNDLAALGRPVVLVLDDLHVIERPEIHDALAFLIDRAPPSVRVVIATRADPPLPLARWRVRGELVEVRAADLRFTPAEAASYLDAAVGGTLSAADVEALEARTEGWIAALQLAALSMRGRSDVGAFIDAFAGDDRYVVDYLVDEVLGRLPAAVRRFLLETSILDRLSAPLCEAVTGDRDARAMLDRIERGNLFLVALDDQRRWYRYHHLFADVLRIRLLDEAADAVPTLHRRASDWFEQQGERADAIRHALAGGDTDGAARLVELALPAVRAARSEGTLRRWLEALPPAAIAARPVLGAALAGARMQTGELDRVAELLDGVAAALAAPDGGRATTDPAALARLPGELAMLRAGHARFTGDLPATILHAREALAVAGPDDHLPRGGASSLLGLASWELGELAVAHDAFADGMAELAAGGLTADVVGGQVTLADIRQAQGRLGDALRTYRHGLAVATERPGPPLRGAADMHVGIADILRERNELAGAREHLTTARELGEANGLPKFPARWRVAEARLRQADGDLAGALALLDAAEPVFFADFSPVIRPIPALRARIHLAQGRVASARDWAAAVGVRPTDDPTYVRQMDLATLARLHLAEGDAAAALALATRLVAAALAGGWLEAALDALIVQAMAAAATHDGIAARRALDAALAIAEPETWVRPFLDAGPSMTSLLRSAARPGSTPGLHGLLLAMTAGGGPVRREALPEPLSARELEVLRLLATDLSGPEIAAHLVVSLNTMRSHTKAIFAKLGVTSRRAAVRRAAELDLLPVDR